MASLAPSSNITIIMINIIIMIILWLYFIIFIIEVEQVLQDITGEELNKGANATLDVWLDIVA